MILVKQSVTQCTEIRRKETPCIVITAQEADKYGNRWITFREVNHWMENRESGCGQRVPHRNRRTVKLQKR